MYTRLEEEEGITWKQVHNRSVLLMYSVLYCKLAYMSIVSTVLHMFSVKHVFDALHLQFICLQYLHITTYSYIYCMAFAHVNCT